MPWDRCMADERVAKHPDPGALCHGGCDVRCARSGSDKKYAKRQEELERRTCGCGRRRSHVGYDGGDIHMSQIGLNPDSSLKAKCSDDGQL